MNHPSPTPGTVWRAETSAGILAVFEVLNRGGKPHYVLTINGLPESAYPSLRAF